MLLDFYVGNFLSFGDIQRFSMRSAENSKNKKNLIKNEKVLRTSFIYGSNAAGKSNLVKAIRFSKMMIVLGHTYGIYQIPNYLHRNPSEKDPKPAYFEYNIDIGGIQYKYGLEVGKHEQIVSEWLYKIENGKLKEIIFEIAPPFNVTKKQKLAENLVAIYSKKYARNVSKGYNGSFLSVAAETNRDCLDVLCWFQEYLVINSFDLPEITVTVDRKYLDFLLASLTRYNTGIISITQGKKWID